MGRLLNEISNPDYLVGVCSLDNSHCCMPKDGLLGLSGGRSIAISYCLDSRYRHLVWHFLITGGKRMLWEPRMEKYAVGLKSIAPQTQQVPPPNESRT